MCFVPVGEYARRLVYNSIGKLGVAPEGLDGFEDVAVAESEGFGLAVGEGEVLDMPFAGTERDVLELLMEASCVRERKAEFLANLRAYEQRDMQLIK